MTDNYLILVLVAGLAACILVIVMLVHEVRTRQAKLDQCQRDLDSDKR